MWMSPEFPHLLMDLIIKWQQNFLSEATMFKKIFLITVGVFVLTGCGTSNEYVGKSRDDILIMLESHQHCKEKIHLRTKTLDTVCSYQFDSIDEIKKRSDVMTSENWDILPEKKFLHDGYYYTRLNFKNGYVVSTNVNIRDGFGGPLQLFLLWLFSL